MQGAIGSFSETHKRSVGLIMPGSLSRSGIPKTQNHSMNNNLYMNDSCNIKQEQTFEGKETFYMTHAFPMLSTIANKRQLSKIVSVLYTEHLIYSIGVIHYWVFGHPVAGQYPIVVLNGVSFRFAPGTSFYFDLATF